MDIFRKNEAPNDFDVKITFLIMLKRRRRKEKIKDMRKKKIHSDLFLLLM